MIKNAPAAILAAAVTIVIFGSMPVAAEDPYPADTIEFITPYPPGGISDNSYRAIEPFLAKELGGTLVNINKVGAGGQVAAEYVARAPADGYTILNGANPIFTSARAMRGEELGVKPEDFVALGTYTLDPTLLVVSKDSPFKTMDELVAYAKDHPGELSAGDGGIGGAGHFTMEALNLTKGLDITTAHFQGAAALKPQVMGGHVSMVLASASTFLPLIESGDLIAIAITSKHPSLPDVPTVAELDAPEAAFHPTQALYVAKGTPAPIVDKLTAALANVMNNPEARKAIEKAGLLSQYEDPAATVAANEQGYERALKIVNALGLSPQ
jgi:tripartite-type tricarboxylate transporter receptor subunit TctC